MVLRDMSPLPGKEATGAGTSFLSEVSETNTQLLGLLDSPRSLPGAKVL